jgi:hypothetical protein
VNKLLLIGGALALTLFSDSVVRAEAPVSLESALANNSIGNMAKFTQATNTQIPTQAQSVLGGTKSINCPKGATPASCIPMAIWNTTFRTGDLTPASVAAKTGKPIDPNQSLAVATPWLSQMKISDVLAADPSLRSMPVVANGRRTTLGALATPVVSRSGNYLPASANQLLGNVVDLRQTKIAQVPQIQNVPFKNFPGLAQLPANVIPNLSQIKLPDMPGFQLNGGIALMKIDVIRTKEKNVRHMVMSGSNQQPNAKCDRNCDYAEFHPWVGLPYLRGAKIISGDSLSVRGGDGLLSWVNGGMEPTGVEANLGSGGVKFVIRNLNAKQGSATVNINFRACGWLVGCTPYFLGIPLFNISERNNWFPLPTTSASVYRVINPLRPF